MRGSDIKNLILYGVRDVHSWGEYKIHIKKEWSLTKFKGRVRSNYMLGVYFLLIGFLDILSTQKGIAMGFTEKNIKQVWLMSHGMVFSDLAVFLGVSFIFLSAMFVGSLRGLKIVMLFYYTVVVTNFTLLILASAGRIVPY